MNLFKALFFISLTALSGCNLKEKVNEAITFRFTENEQFSVPGTSVVGIPVPLDIGTPDVSSSSQQAFENNNTEARLVDEIILTELNMTITNPSTRTFSFLKSVEIYISTDSSNEILLAEKQDIPNDIGNTIELETSNANLKSYVSGDTYSLRYEVTVRETTSSETDINAEMVFRVSADIL